MGVHLLILGSLRQHPEQALFTFVALLSTELMLVAWVGDLRGQDSSVRGPHENKRPWKLNLWAWRARK